MKAPPLRKHAPERRGEAGLVEFTVGDGNHGVVDRIEVARLGSAHWMVQSEKRQCCRDGGALVAVEESLRFGDVKGVAGGHIKHFTASLDGGTERRFDHAIVAAASRATEGAQRIPVEFIDLCALQKPEHRKLLCEASEQVAVVLEHVRFRLGKTRGALRLLASCEFEQGLRDFLSIFSAHAPDFVFNFSDRHGPNLPHAPLPSSLHFSP